VRRSSVYPQEDQCRFPHHNPSFRIGGLLPDISISVLRSRNNTIGIGGPVDGSNCLVVLVGERDVIGDDILAGWKLSTNLCECLSRCPRRSLTAENLSIARVQTGGDL
jgi:hypothetical protein